MTKVWAIYVRRSSKDEDDADVSDETQELVARRRVPAGEPVEVFRDSGGKHSGYSDQRDEYQRMLDWLHGGRLAGIATYDLTRLNRNTGNASDLYDMCKALRVPLRWDDSPVDRILKWDTKLTYDIQSAVGESYRSQLSERMVAQARMTFESGGHRGNDPFGYRTAREWSERKHAFLPVRVDRVVRLLEIVPEEAVVVRRVFALLASHPFSETAEIMQREGIKRRASGPWTTAAIKDLYRRRKFYIGMVTSGRGAEDRQGRHPVILTEQEYADALAGVESRKRHTGAKPTFARRTYLLRGLIYCSCGARMRGDTRVARGKGWSYYACPVADGRHQMEVDGQPVDCHARRVPAREAERFVVEGLASAVLPPDVIEAAGAELRRRMESPTPGQSDKERGRLRTRIEQLRKQHEWGDITDTEYRKARSEVEAALAAIPGDSDKVVLFDRHRRVIQSLGDTLADATPEAIQSIVSLLVERVETDDRHVVGWLPTGPAEPFFDSAMLSLWRPRTDSNRRRAP